MSSVSSVCFVTLVLTHYRIRFHELVHALLAQHDVEYKLIYSPPQGEAAKKGDVAVIEWAEMVNAQRLALLGREAYWQPVFTKCKRNDLVIVGQENKLLVNYFLQIRYLLGGTKIAFWGHGKNYQSSAPNGLAERWKQFWLTKVHWWFGYTQETAKIVKNVGFPEEQITVCNNSIDMGKIRREVEDIPVEEVEALRHNLGIESKNIGIYIGGMYKEKRLDFLVEAALLIRKQVPDFQFLLIGSGVDAPIAEDAAQKHSFIHYLGPKFGREKTTLAMMSKVFLMPGAVGLAVLDSFAYGLPMVTSNVSTHGPEIAYLDNGVNAIVTQDAQDVHTYAQTVSDLLQAEDRRQSLCVAALKSSEDYSIEAMAEHFADGVLQALAK